MTLLLYLDDLASYDGGATSFESATPGEPPIAVRVPRGGALCFFHGEHPLSPLHEGSQVKRGAKHVIRTDVLYHAGSCAGESDAETEVEGSLLDIFN